MHMNAVAALLAASVLSIGAGAASGASATTSVVAVKVKLDEMAITPSLVRVNPGKVTFDVKNAGTLPHEFVVLRTTLGAGKLPVANGKASETGHVGEIGDLAAGASKTLTLDLTKGHYLLVCNLAGHYQAGMRATLVVR